MSLKLLSAWVDCFNVYKVKQIIPYLCAVLWLCGLGVGLRAEIGFTNTPGTAAHSPTKWPSDTTLVPFSNLKPTLVVSLHSQCSCSLATLQQLQALAISHPDSFAIHLLYFKPAVTEADWTAGQLWRLGKEIPGAKLYTDLDGLEAERFGATTSGHITAYSKTGELQFSGGITPARGHTGEADGMSALRKIAAGAMEEADLKAPTFGCALSHHSRSTPDANG